MFMFLSSSMMHQKEVVYLMSLGHRIVCHQLVANRKNCCVHQKNRPGEYQKFRSRYLFSPNIMKFDVKIVQYQLGNFFVA